MKFVVQRVSEARVKVAGRVIAQIGRGLLVLVAIHREDTQAEADRWIEKILKLRIFPDEAKPMNRSVQDIQGEILWVSQFTLYGDTQGQNRPSFMAAAPPHEAQSIYQYLITQAARRWPRSASGQFAQDMQVELVNDGPVTMIMG